METERKKILAACSAGEITTLEAMFQQFNIGPDHPADVYCLDRNTPMEQQLPDVSRMLKTAIESQQVETLRFLGTKFPKPSFFGTPMKAALESGNTELLKAVCELEPEIANMEMGDESNINALAFACSQRSAANLIEVLLQCGADPDAQPPMRLPARRNVSSAVINGLPVSTIERFFDFGYQGTDPFAISYAVEHERLDVVEVLFRRTKALPNAQLPPENDMLQKATDCKNEEMIVAIKDGYASRKKQKKGLILSLASKVWAWK
ncbi:unnamed protein product [Periconia digitata]|uniref:Uncharacterized protein n=1 Tax=Periconia digitata TaxID=1303443 RepID=A0A9W4U2H8_9PLEO|nr:unnamed protein product [Periconia digitata]